MVNVTSVAHIVAVDGVDYVGHSNASSKPYDCVYLYGSSKLANILFTQHINAVLANLDTPQVRTVCSCDDHMVILLTPLCAFICV